MTRPRFLLVLLLFVSFDLCAVEVPTPRGIVWDEDEEVVHVRRSAASPRRLAPAGPMPEMTAARSTPRPILRASFSRDHPAGVDAQPRADLSTEPPAPTEDH
jgi:hypothetical protein